MLIGSKQLGEIGNILFAYTSKGLWLGACALFFLGGYLATFPGHAIHWSMLGYRQYVIPTCKRMVALINSTGRAWNTLNGFKKRIATALILPLLSFRYAVSRHEVWRYLQHIALFDMFFLPLFIPSVVTSWVLVSLLLQVSTVGLWAVGAYSYFQSLAGYQWEDIAVSSNLGLARASAHGFDPVQASHFPDGAVDVTSSSDLPHAIPAVEAMPVHDRSPVVHI